MVLKPHSHHFFSIYSQKNTSCIGCSDEETNKRDIVENDLFTIYPGKYFMDVGEEEFFEKILDQPDFVLPSGKIHFRTVRISQKILEFEKFLDQSFFGRFLFFCC